MKGYLDVLTESLTFFVSSFVFSLIIVLLMISETPLSNEKQLKDMTKEERFEFFQYHEKFRVFISRISLTTFISIKYISNFS